MNINNCEKQIQSYKTTKNDSPFKVQRAILKVQQIPK